jgi:hypothetical protein
VTRLGCAVLAVLAAAGCGNRSGTQGHGSAIGSGSAAPHDGSAVGTDRDPEPGAPPDATAELVRDAFAGKVPAFPLLSRDGTTAAVGIASPVGRSRVSTYHVATFAGWTSTTDAWGSSAQLFPIIDPTMAAMLLDRAQGEAAPLPDHATLTGRATAIQKRLNDGGFSPFDGPAIAIGPGDTVVGAARLRITHERDAGVTAELLDAGGRELATRTIAPYLIGLVADVECVSTPVARRAWVDARRKRVLVEIGWNAGPAICPAPDAEYGVLPLP